jgi:hypothetical protein
MAIEQHPTIRGFRVQENNVETSCGGDNTSSATAIVGNTQNTAVLGNICSAGMVSALPIYEAAGVVTTSGSASASLLPPLELIPRSTSTPPPCFSADFNTCRKS